MQLPQSDSEQRALTPTALVDLKCQKNCACSRFREGCRCKYRSDWSCRCGWRACVCQPSARRSRSRSCSRSRSRSRSRSASPTILRCCGNDQGEKDSFLAQIPFTYKCSGCKKNFECWNGKKDFAIRHQWCADENHEVWCGSNECKNHREQKVEVEALPLEVCSICSKFYCLNHLKQCLGKLNQPCTITTKQCLCCYGVWRAAGEAACFTCSTNKV